MYTVLDMLRLYTSQVLLRQLISCMRCACTKKPRKNTRCARFDASSRWRPETSFRTKHNNQPLNIVQYAYWANVDALLRAIGAAHLVFYCIFYEGLNSRFPTIRRFLCTEKSTQHQDTELILDMLIVEGIDVGYMSLVLFGMLCGCRCDGTGGRPSGDHRLDVSTTGNRWRTYTCKSKRT